MAAPSAAPHSRHSNSGASAAQFSALNTPLPPRQASSNRRRVVPAATLARAPAPSPVGCGGRGPSLRLHRPGGCGSRGGRPISYDRNLYKGRNIVQRTLNLPEQWRGLATMSDKHAVNYRSAVVLAAILTWGYELLRSHIPDVRTSSPSPHVLVR